MKRFANRWGVKEKRLTLYINNTNFPLINMQQLKHIIFQDLLNEPRTHLYWCSNIYHSICRGVYSSRKSKLFPSAMRRLQNPSPPSKVTGAFLTRGVDQSLTWGGGWFCVMHRGCLRGNVPPSEAGKFCIFEIEIVQFDEYFWEQIYSRWWWVKNQFYRPNWPKFCILGVILVKIVSKNWKSAVFWPKSIDLGWIV